jgi:hypothetical protein
MKGKWSEDVGMIRINTMKQLSEIPKNGVLGLLPAVGELLELVYPI